MKQKNFLLVGLAAVCGLAAAVLTSKLGARPAKVEETVAVLVASKDIPVGTRLKKEDLDTYLETKEFTKETVPAQYIGVKDDLADKRTVRTMRKGDAFNPADVTKFASLSPPEGFDMVSVGCTLEQGVAGFATPGSRVNILAAIPVRDRRNKDRGEAVSYVVPLMLDMLILAVDSQSQVNAESNTVPTISTVSFAVTPEQGLLLHAAKHRACDLRLVLRNQDKPNKYEHTFTHKELWSILAEVPTFDEEGKRPEQADDKVEKVKLPVALEDLPAGTELTKDVIDKKFEMKEFAKPVPPSAIENLREFGGKYLTSKLGAGQFVPKSFVGDKEKDAAKPEAATPNTPKPGPVEPKEPKKPEAPPVFKDITVQTPNGVQKHRYQVLPDGSYKYLGILPHDGEADKAPAADDDDPKPAPKPKPKGEPKADPKAEPKGEKRGEKRGEPVDA